MRRDCANTHAAPGPPPSPGPPTIAVVPLPESATDQPCRDWVWDPMPTSLGPCWSHVLPFRANTHAAPRTPSSLTPPTRARPPLADNDTDQPCAAAPTAPAPSSRGPCLLQRPPDRRYIQAAPTPPVFPGEPTSAKFAAADSETEGEAPPGGGALGPMT